MLTMETVVLNINAWINPYVLVASSSVFRNALKDFFLCRGGTGIGAARVVRFRAPDQSVGAKKRISNAILQVKSTPGRTKSIPRPQGHGDSSTVMATG